MLLSHVSLSGARVPLMSDRLVMVSMLSGDGVPCDISVQCPTVW